MPPRKPESLTRLFLLLAGAAVLFAITIVGLSLI